jgi:circadian clock protein KaiB
MMGDAPLRLSLYVAGDSVNSRQAVRNLRKFCGEEIKFEVVDVLEDGQAALDKQIWVTPTLLIENGGDSHRVIGTLSDAEVLERTLDRPPARHSSES